VPLATIAASKVSGSALIAETAPTDFDPVATIVTDLKSCIAEDPLLLELPEDCLNGLVPDEVMLDDAISDMSEDAFEFEHTDLPKLIDDNVSMEDLDLNFFSETSVAPIPVPAPLPVPAVVETASVAVAKAKAAIPKPSKMKGPSRRAAKRSVPESEKDEAYWKKRNQNTINAKTARQRKAIADKAKTEYVEALGVENAALTTHLKSLLAEVARLSKLASK